MQKYILFWNSATGGVGQDHFADGITFFRRELLQEFVGPLNNFFCFLISN